MTLEPGSSELGRWLMIGGVLLIPILVGAVFIVLARRMTSRQAARLKTAPMTARRQEGRGGHLLLFGGFAGLGSALTVAFLVLPLWRVWQAQHWQPTPCVIESSKVITQSDSDGSTYRPQITYRYEFGGQEYQSDRYDFMGGSSSGHAGKQAIVNRYPPNLVTNCWVNPSEPDQAVLHRGLVGTMVFGLIPVLFATIGIGGLVYTFRRRKVETGAVAESGPAHVADDSPRELRPAESRIGRVLGTLGVAVFWNGISWTIFFNVWRDREWMAVAFLSIFVLIGALLFLVAGYTLLALANPRPFLTLANSRLRHGPPQVLTWRISGTVSRLRRLTITLEGREVASYTRGTDRLTERAVFAREVIFTSELSSAFHTGEADIVLPPSAPPGFVAENNRVEWMLKVQGVIAVWPDMVEEFPVEIAGKPFPMVVEPPPLPTTNGEAMTHSPDGSLAIGTESGRLMYLPGETLVGAAGWSVSKAPKSAEVRLFWHTHGKGTQDVCVVATVPLANPASQEVRSFEIALPTGPWSVDGRLVSLVWGLELVLEPGGRNVRRELVIAPGGAPANISDSLPDEQAKAGWAKWLQLKR